MYVQAGSHLFQRGFSLSLAPGDHGVLVPSAQPPDPNVANRVLRVVIHGMIPGQTWSAVVRPNNLNAPDDRYIEMASEGSGSAACWWQAGGDCFFTVPSGHDLWLERENGEEGSIQVFTGYVIWHATNALGEGIF